MAKKSPPSQRLRQELLEETRRLAAESGWTISTLHAAVRNLDMTSGEENLAAPKGIDSLLEAWANESDVQTLLAMENADLANMKIREKVAFGVKARIASLTPHRESAIRAGETLAAPWRAPLSTKILWNAADTIWAGLGDKSTDGNWYTKRLTLSAVIGATLTTWLTKDEEAAWVTLENRIEDLMKFEKFKATVKKRTAGFPDPLDILKLIPAPRTRD